MTALVDEFAYIILDVIDTDAWARFAGDIVGAQVEQEGATVRLRLDDRPFRYLIRRRQADRLPALGWRVADADALTAVKTRLGDIGLEPAQIEAAELHDRRAAAGLRFSCPNGIDHEVVCGLEGGGAFTPSADVSGFVTGPGGLGHIVWGAPNLEAMDRLMMGAFGMALREDISTPSGVGHFYGCNARHHSLAAFSAPALRLEHIMVEMKDLDDVGCAMDRAVDADYPLTQPLGRHRTDHMVSFYLDTPSGFGMEIGCGGVLCDDSWPQVRDANRRRPWGHGAAMRRHHQRLAVAGGERK
jgi:3,4-dihydroxy-9,10-secoandrosta-1,3,5(10)-triene-9,17-dione 4,5-dioxygenase